MVKTGYYHSHTFFIALYRVARVRVAKYMPPRINFRHLLDLYATFLSYVSINCGVPPISIQFNVFVLIPSMTKLYADLH